MCTLKRYLVFKFDGYEPQGGWDDLICTYDKKEEAFADARQLEFNQCSHVVDIQIGKKIAWFSNTYGGWFEKIIEDN